MMFNKNKNFQIFSALMVLLLVFMCTRGRSENYINTFDECRDPSQNIFITIPPRGEGQLPYVTFTQDSRRIPGWRKNGCTNGKYKKTVKGIIKTISPGKVFASTNMTHDEVMKLKNFGTNGEIKLVFPTKSPEGEHAVLQFWRQAILEKIPSNLLDGKYEYFNMLMSTNSDKKNGTIYYKAFTTEDIKKYGLKPMVVKYGQSPQMRKGLFGSPIDLTSEQGRREFRGGAGIFLSPKSGGLPSRGQMKMLEKVNALLDAGTVRLADAFPKHVANLIKKPNGVSSSSSGTVKQDANRLVSEERMETASQRAKNDRMIQKK